MDTAWGLLEGELEWDDPQVLENFYRCNTCGGCDAMCKGVQDMEPLRAMIEMRAQLVEKGNLLPQHIPVIENLRKEDNMMMEKKAGRGRWAEGLGVKDLTREKGEVVFHAGCRTCFDKEMWPAARAAVSLLKSMGADIGVMGAGESCCGGRAYSMGYRGEFTKFAESNIQLWSTAGVKTVVTACADGYYAFKRLYPDVGSKVEVLHIVEYIERLMKQKRLKFQAAKPLRVTYHDPCHLGRRLAQAPGFYVPGEPIMGLYEEPRNILRSLPGVELTEMFRIKEYAWCCGSGGGVIEAYPEFNRFTATERVKEAQTTGADVLVTACPWCKRSLTDAVNDLKANLKVLDILELVQDRIKI
jgi:Fe-S oxidoreductase